MNRGWTINPYTPARKQVGETVELFIGLLHRFQRTGAPARWVKLSLVGFGDRFPGVHDEIRFVEHTSEDVQRLSSPSLVLERLLEGNISLQMFTTVTKSPRGQNYEENSSEAFDNISTLALIQRWPAATRESLAARALYQAERIHQAAANSPQLQVVLNQRDLETVLAKREAGTPIVGALIGTEGSHALDAKIDNVDRLYDAGFRMMSLQHFFDNALGGSLHGESNQGLTFFGEQAVDRMIALGIMIDVAHSSEAVVQDLLAKHPVPLIVSHTGFQGHCASPRNISDDTMELITNAGGLIGVGFWDGATCGSDVDSIVGAIRYGIDRFGLEHIALGSDWDGAISAPFDAANIAQLTQGLLDAEFSEAEIRAVMGDNMVRFLKTHLPPSD